MQVQDARRVREATEVLAAAVGEMDLGAMLPATHRELVALGERIERTGRTVKALAAAKVAESAAWRGITAYAEMLKSAETPLSGVDSIVSKPFLLENLRAAIEDTTAGKKPTDP
jgi:hypothetical protein